MNKNQAISALLVVAALSLAFVGLMHKPKPQTPTPHMTPFVSCEVTLIGDVTDVSPTIWDGSGHTSITVGDNTPVLIIGSLGAPGHEPTLLKLKDRLLRRWIGKRVKIIGTRIVDNGKALIAKVIEELPIQVKALSDKVTLTGTVTKLNAPCPLCPHGGITVDGTLVLIVGRGIPGHEPTSYAPADLSVSKLVGHKVSVTGTHVYNSTAIYAETLEALSSDVLTVVQILPTDLIGVDGLAKVQKKLLEPVSIGIVDLTAPGSRLFTEARDAYLSTNPGAKGEFFAVRLRGPYYNFVGFVPEGRPEAIFIPTVDIFSLPVKKDESPVLLMKKCSPVSAVDLIKSLKERASHFRGGAPS